MRVTKRLKRHNAPKCTLTREQVTGKTTEKYILKKNQRTKPAKKTFLPAYPKQGTSNYTKRLQIQNWQ